MRDYIRINKTTEFINKSKEVHGDKYDYSKVVYENNLKEVERALTQGIGTVIMK